MRASALVIVSGILAGLCCGPAAAHRPYFSQSEAISTARHPAVTLKLLNGDGILFADPARAVVVDQDGTLLAVSPLLRGLGIYCANDDGHRTCLAYDHLTRRTYQPMEDQWRDGGLVVKDDRPQQYPETMTSEFGFTERQATIGEIARFEVVGMVASWITTGIALAWWALFWLLLGSAGRYIFGRDRRFTIGRIVVLLVQISGALLMIPAAAFVWLQGPYSVVYLAFGVTGGAMIALLPIIWRKPQASRIR